MEVSAVILAGNCQFSDLTRQLKRDIARIRLVPVEVKYRSRGTGLGELKGIQQFCAEKKVPGGVCNHE